jgi:sugar phosphate isomerase/epimerase
VKLGLGSYAYAWAIGVPGYPPPPQPMDARGLVRRAAALGLRVVQIADNLPLDALTPAEIDALDAEARALGVAVEVGTRGIAPDHLRTFLALAVRFGSPILRVVVDTATHHPDPDEIVATLRPLLPEFAGAGVVLAIENHDRFKARTLAEIVERLNASQITRIAGICLDTVNSFGALEGPDAVVAALGPHVVNLHVKEFTVRRVDHKMGFVVEGAPAGAGMLDVPWLLSALAGCVDLVGVSAIIETWPAPEATPDATVAKEDAWVVQSAAYLRTLIAG